MKSEGYHDLIMGFQAGKRRTPGTQCPVFVIRKNLDELLSYGLDSQHAHNTADGSPHFLDSGTTINLPKLAFPAIVLSQRECILFMDCEAFQNDVFRVIGTHLQLGSVVVADTIFLCRMKMEVVDPATARAGTSSRKTTNELVALHVDLDG